MKFMMFVAIDPEFDAGAEPDDPDAIDTDEWVARHDASGARVVGERLRPVEDSTTVRRRNGKVLVTDGPFAKSREWIVGFDILESADLDEAIGIASQHPMARAGRLELRPFWTEEDSG